ncbi:3884_t:CDS:2 [Entrophospora sp. SA101]|nr:3884_t:CDS:2 [Entrophospora sp. SA101]
MSQNLHSFDFTDKLNLEEGLTFVLWEQAKLFFDNFALQEGKHNPQIITDPTKHHNVHSQKTECPWHINLSFPKSSNLIKIDSFVNAHNHSLNTMIGEMVPQFQKLTSSMLKDIKKYVVKGRMDSASIYPFLINDYPQNTINKRNLYNAVYNIRQQNNPGRKCGKCGQFGHYASTCMD